MSLTYLWAVITILAQFYGFLHDKSVRLLKVVFMVLIFPTFGRRSMNIFKGIYFSISYFFLWIKNFKENLVYAVCIVQKWQVCFCVNKREVMHLWKNKSNHTFTVGFWAVDYNR